MKQTEENGIGDPAVILPNEQPVNNGPLFNGNSIEKAGNPNSNLQTVDMSGEDLPDLDEAAVSPLDLAMNYWTPTTPGDTKNVYFDKIESAQYRDVNDADVVVELLTVFMYTKTKAEGVKGWSNASKKLVSILERSHIEKGTPLKITYLGKKKNSTNNFHSDDWSVKPLILKIG